MRRMFSAMLVVAVVISLLGCSSPVKSETHMDSYVPNKKIVADFEEITLIDVAFSGKAQVYITENTYSTETSVNGKAVESVTKTIVTPGYTYAAADGILFTMKTQVKNTGMSKLELLTIPAFVTFGEGEPLYMQKGVNCSPAGLGRDFLEPGETGEVIFAASVSVEEYRTADSCILTLADQEIYVPYSLINVYASMGYEATDSIPITMDRLMQSLGNEMTAEETPAEQLTGLYENGNQAVGTAIAISDVSVSFSDRLPQQLYAEYSRIGNSDEHILEEGQVYAAVCFSITNHTKQELLLANMNDDFVVDINYNQGFVFSTNHETDCYYETKTTTTRASGKSRLGSPVAVPVLTTIPMTIYIPCAETVAADRDHSLAITFHSRFGDYEKFDFVIR